MIEGFSMDEALELKISVFSDFFQLFLLFDLVISFFDDEIYLLGPFFVNKLNFKHFFGKHLWHILHQTLKKLCSREADIDTQLITRVLFKVYLEVFHRF